MVAVHQHRRSICKAYTNTALVVGQTSSYDRSGNKFYERELHAESRSHLYEPFNSDCQPQGGYDSINRLRQYQRGVLSSTGGCGNQGGGSVITAISLPNTDEDRTYDLDGLGNWKRTVFTPEGGSATTQVRDHNSLNEITRLTEGATQTPFTYDGAAGASNGNLANDGTRKYEYDALNRLTRVWKTPVTPVLIAEYTYDALGRRVRRDVSNGGLSGNITNGTTDFLYNSKVQCVEERNSSNAATKQMLWGIYVDELIQQKNLVALNNFAANDELYPLQDLLYRTTGLADSSGTIREAYDCDAYGNTLIFRNTGTPPAEITFSNSDTQIDEPTCEFIYTGRRYDAETENYFYRARYYAPEWGRFGQRDPIGFEGSEWNLYEYVGSSPIARIDPSGHACTLAGLPFIAGPPVVSFVGGTVGIVISTNPNPVSVGLASGLVCARKRTVTLTYNCSCWEWPCFWVDSLIMVSVVQEQTKVRPLSQNAGELLIAINATVAPPVPTPIAPGFEIAAIQPADWGKATAICNTVAFDPWPAFPATQPCS